MKLFKFIFVFVVLAFSLVLQADNSNPEKVLYWEVDASDRVDFYGINTVGALIDANKVNAARVRVDGGGTPVYLNLYTGGGDTPWKLWDEKPYSTIAEFNSSSKSVGPCLADIAPYAGTSGASFVIELGFATWGDNDVQWNFVVESMPAMSSSDLSNFISSDALVNAVQMAWHPTGTYAVPEPTGSMLLLIGGALLALKRRCDV